MLAMQVVHAWPGVEKTAGVAGGDACIVRTRIAVRTLETYRRLGWNEAKILENFPTLRAVDLVSAWSYADAHRAEIDAAIAENAGNAGRPSPTRTCLLFRRVLARDEAAG